MDDVAQFVDHGRVEGVGERKMHGGIEDGDGEALVHAGGVGRDGGEDLGGQFCLPSWMTSVPR